MKIKELKQILDAKTSEELFGIDKQPEDTCPKIDRGLRDWGSVRRNIEGYCKDLKKCDSVDDAEKIGSDIDWEIGTLDIIAEYNELRNQCAWIRVWGQGWKDIAKKLIEERDNVDDLLSDKFFLLLTKEEKK
jgi:hypothetical protein